MYTGEPTFTRAEFDMDDHRRDYAVDSEHYYHQAADRSYPYDEVDNRPDLSGHASGIRNRPSARGMDNPAFVQDEVDYPGARRRRLPRSQSTYEKRDRQDYDPDYDADGDSVETLVPGISPEDLARTMDFLATIRVKRRQGKSLRRRHSDYIDHEGETGVGEEEEEEVVGLPTKRAHPKTKPLAEKLQEARKKPTPQAAKAIRDSVLEIDPDIRGISAKAWQKTLLAAKESLNSLEVWAQHFKEIEGQFGSATASYFRFTRWLVFLNLFTFLVTFLVIVVPYIASSKPEFFQLGENPFGLNDTSTNSSWVQAQSCSKSYQEALDNSTSNQKIQDKILGFVIGTGWMEKTTMFYGSYHNRSFEADSDSYTYNMGLAYLLAVGLVFLISFLFIVGNSSQAVKDAVTTDKDQSNVHYTNSVLCGWDFCINDKNAAESKKGILKQEFEADLMEQKKRLERQNRTGRQRLKLYLTRLAINVLVLAMLCSSLYLVYYTTDKLLELRKTVTDPVLTLVVQFLPSVTITILNFVVPVIFQALVSVEDYRPSFQLKITLFRCVLLRLASLGVLLVSLYYTLQYDKSGKYSDCLEEGRTNVSECCSNILWNQQDEDSAGALSNVKCWETYVGQQFYKLALVDFAAIVVKTFLVEFPRKLIFERFKKQFVLVEKFGQQYFDLPENVLDIVYSQTLSWLGMFFAPLLPAMTLLKVFFIFYIKKLTLLKNYAPSQNAYKASNSNSFFMTILLFSFIVTAAVIGYMVGNIQPSKSCGPFRVHSNEDYKMWTALTDEISSWPKAASEFFFFFGTPAFFVPAFILLCLLMYYYWAVAQGYKRKETLVQDQLKMEGKDKQFLLARVNDIVKSTQNQRAAI